MAHDVIGLDLGSCEVKAVIVRMAMRGVEVTRVAVEPVEQNENGRSTREQVIDAAARLFERLELSGEETVYCAAFGETVSIRRVSVPIGAAKKLEQVVKFEVDEIVPFDINDAVFDFVETGRSSGQISLVSAAMLIDHAAEFLEGLKKKGIEPRELGVASLAYGLAYFQKRERTDETVAIVDMGHERTDIAVFDPLTPTVRTILRGGRDLTERLAKKGNVDFEKAENYKLQNGLTGKVGEVLRDGLRPFVREIQQTLKGHLAADGKRVDKIVLCGGGSLLKQLDDHLSEELGIPVERHAPIFGAAGNSLTDDDASTFVLAYALALREGTPRANRVNLRRGKLEFKGDYEFLKRRIGWAIVCAVAILFSWIFASYVEYSVLDSEVGAKRAALVERSKGLFGKPLTDYGEIKKKFSFSEEKKAPMPKVDAFDIVVELSRRIPNSVVHDLEFLEIKPKRITLKGIVDEELMFEPTAEPGDPTGEVSEKEEGSPDLSPTDLVKEKLSEFKECFTAIRVGKVSSVDNRRRYTMDIDSKCP